MSETNAEMATQEVVGSIPISSTRKRYRLRRLGYDQC